MTVKHIHEPFLSIPRANDVNIYMKSTFYSECKFHNFRASSTISVFSTAAGVHV